ncbi:site-specific recombinase XerC [Pseudomonas duriflava]|uniref:Site-specific recombinase XerC n=1 Tax=Pseudomonas duriflava TaxID=459528 RepID=A0A562Q7F4_9PSED|nr:tyrosine-type recombinase/integrase [Pseudomonas duriflava]TWI52695.1 site-specific recombinase XerC [Pseudomonas duriflava]
MSLPSISPQPLFDTYSRFLGLSIASFEAEHTAILDFLQRLESHVPAKADYGHVREFLRSYAGWETTFKAYRTQVERLLLWSWLKEGKSILSLRRQDAEAFLAFSQEPDETWVGTSVRRRFLEVDGVMQPNPQWRPFGIQGNKASRKLAAETGSEEITSERYEMAQGSLKQVFAICSSFFDYLNDQDVLVGNPFRAIKQKSRFFQKKAKAASGKVLDRLQWEFVIETAEWMANEDPERYERTLFIVATLFSLYLRVSELSGRPGWFPTMDAFQKDPDGSWWYVAIGKGNKERRISVSDEMLGYLKRYRAFRNLTPLPYAGDPAPLLTKHKGQGGLTDRQIRNLVQECFDMALQRMQEEGRSEDEVSNLRAASAHWLRHTSATYDAPNRPLKHLQEDLGHAKASTTQDIYYNAINQERAASGKYRRMKEQ